MILTVRQKYTLHVRSSTGETCTICSSVNKLTTETRRPQTPPPPPTVVTRILKQTRKERTIVSSSTSLVVNTKWSDELAESWASLFLRRKKGIGTSSGSMEVLLLRGWWGWKHINDATIILACPLSHVRTTLVGICRRWRNSSQRTTDFSLEPGSCQVTTMSSKLSTLESRRRVTSTHSLWSLKPIVRGEASTSPRVWARLIRTNTMWCRSTSLTLTWSMDWSLIWGSMCWCTASTLWGSISSKTGLPGLVLSGMKNLIPTTCQTCICTWPTTLSRKSQACLIMVKVMARAVINEVWFQFWNCYNRRVDTALRRFSTRSVTLWSRPSSRYNLLWVTFIGVVNWMMWKTQWFLKS